MIFQHTWQQVVDGNKTMTRRLVRPGETLRHVYSELGERHSFVFTANGRIVFEAGRGKTTAVQPGRGKKSIARIRITDIRQEDVRQISAADAICEGFIGQREFLETWVGMHDKQMCGYPLVASTGDSQLDYHQNEDFWDVIVNRPVDRYTAWVLTFEAVTP